MLCEKWQEKQNTHAHTHTRRSQKAARGTSAFAKKRGQGAEYSAQKLFLRLVNMKSLLLLSLIQVKVRASVQQVPRTMLPKLVPLLTGGSCPPTAPRAEGETMLRPKGNAGCYKYLNPIHCVWTSQQQMCSFRSKIANASQPAKQKRVACSSTFSSVGMLC